MVRGTDPGSPFIRNKPEMSFIFQNDSTISFAGCWGVIACIFQGDFEGSSIHKRLCTSCSIVKSHRAFGDLSIITASIIENLKFCV